MSKIFVIPAILFGGIVWIGIGMWIARIASCWR